MIPVYVVVAQMREGQFNQAVFSSEATAQAYIAKCSATPLSQYVNYYVEEFHLDSSPDSLEVL